MDFVPLIEGDLVVQVNRSKTMVYTVVLQGYGLVTVQDEQNEELVFSRETVRQLTFDEVQMYLIRRNVQRLTLAVQEYIRKGKEP